MVAQLLMTGLFDPPSAPSATSAFPAAIAASARLGADSERRKCSGLDENLYRLLPSCHGFINSPAVNFLSSNFALLARSQPCLNAEEKANLLVSLSTVLPSPD